MRFVKPLMRSYSIVFICLLFVSCGVHVTTADDSTSGSRISEAPADEMPISDQESSNLDSHTEDIIVANPLEMLFPIFDLSELLSMNGTEIIKQIESDGFVFEPGYYDDHGGEYWYNREKYSMITFGSFGGKDAREALLVGESYAQITIVWNVLNITEEQLIEWSGTWEGFVDSAIEWCGLVNEVNRGYVSPHLYRANGICDFRDGEDGYWIVSCEPIVARMFLASVRISKYDMDEDRELSMYKDKDTFLKTINFYIKDTPIDTIVTLAPYEGDDFSVAYGGKSGETHVLNVTIKNAELSQSEAEARVYEWLEKEFYTPEDFEYTWERATG